MSATPDLNVVIMAKHPEPGRVKTRLIEGGLSPLAAAEIARAMLRCVVRRWSKQGTLHLAVTPDGHGEALRKSLGLKHVRLIDQGPGDLGARLKRVWSALEPDRPVAFVGMDSPDVPAAHLGAIGPALRKSDAAVGRTGDGGYWVLAARARHEALLDRIDWGTASVYDQTCQRAREAGLSLAALPVWHDVDDVADLAALRGRLRPWEAADGAAGDDAAALRDLARRLAALLSESMSSERAP